MSGFSIDWLNLRESADRDARDYRLLKRAKQWLEGEEDPKANTLVDLGAGTGSTLRTFQEAGLANSRLLRWRLVDSDPTLLAEAVKRYGGSHLLEPHELDLNEIASLPLVGARLVTASALFDLVSSEFVDELVDALREQLKDKSLGLYAALNYDGTTRWSPGHPLDEAVLAAFNRDQCRDKGFGAALGPDAGAYLKARLEAEGFTVLQAASPWRLDGGDSELVVALIEGIADAVAKDLATESGELEHWLKFRKQHAATGSCEIGHTDILAMPQTS